MRLVPVVDLRGGIVVHAVRGERERYAPLRSPLVEAWRRTHPGTGPATDPVVVARALLHAARAADGAATGGSRGDRHSATAIVTEPALYVADLDAIAGASPQQEARRRLATVAPLLIDAGAPSLRSTAERTQGTARAAEGGVAVVVGTESLGSDGAAVLDRIAAAHGTVSLSVDLHRGRLLSRDPALRGRPADAARALARRPGVRGLIVLDLARVGAGEGPALEDTRRVARWADGRDVLAGGGVRDRDDLERLREAGATGALVATALHRGAL